MSTPAISVENSGAASGAKSGVKRELPVRVRDSREGAGQRPSTPAARKSRLLKGTSALQSRPRRSAGELRYSLVPLLTDRDREIVAAVARFKVFTAEQLAEMFFDTRKRAQVRLHRLHQLGVLDRFQPYREGWGSSPYHYVLGPLGAEMAVATAEDDDERPVRWPSATGLALGRPRDLARLRTVNGFYASLVGHARRHPEGRLLDWMAAEETARWSHGLVEPDAFGEWAEGDRTVEFFLVVDRGGPVEAHVADLSRYERFDRERGVTACVLLAFSSPAREKRFRSVLDDAGATAATAVATSISPVHVHAWMPAPGSHRAPLAALRQNLGDPSTDETSSPRAWRFKRRHCF
jgi:hypothetical protein